MPNENVATQEDRQPETPGDLPASDTLWRLLPEIARMKMAAKPPVQIGATHFYQVSPGWETQILEREAGVCKTTDTFELEEAFANPEINTILIPGGASVSRSVALQICHRHSQAKTVFFEEDETP